MLPFGHDKKPTTPRTPTARDEHTHISNADLYAPAWVSRDQQPTTLVTEIPPSLYMGGTHDDDTVVQSCELPIGLGTEEFDAVATLYAWANLMGWGVEEMRLGIYDSDLDAKDVERVMRLAVWAHSRWESGDRVLVRCQAGQNRSGLVTALVLMLAGYTGIEAIRTIRARRSEVALCNDLFALWLATEAGEIVAGYRSPSTPTLAA